MGVMRDIPFGEKFGKLTILREVDSGKHANGKTKRMVEVQCDCGNICTKFLTYVKIGHTKTCGKCKQDRPIKDVSGKKIGFLTVTDTFVRVEEGGANWKCVCECGNERWVHSSVLSRRGKTIHCGECRTPKGSHKFGDWYSNSRGQKFKLLDTHNLNGTTYCTMEDSEGRRFTIQYGNLTDRHYLSPWEVSVAGVGYFGVGRFIAKGYREDRHTKEYEDWNSMLKRCYVGVSSETSYKDVEVCDEWHNFQNFAEWATKQPFFGLEGYALDKDLLVKNANLYSPKTCCYLPREINSFIKRKRMNDLPLGVDIGRDYNGSTHFRAQAREDGRNVMLGRFSTAEAAFYAYKRHKEGLAKALAEKWKGRITEDAYEALYNYTVDITD